MRNQSNLLIGYHLAGSPDPRRNGEAWLQSQLAPHIRTFADVGAHVGDWTAELLQLAPSAAGVLFEPSPEASARIRSRFVEDPRVELIEAAVGDAEGVAAFFDEGVSGQTSSFWAETSSPGASRREIAVVTIDETMRARGCASLDFVKVDAEGSDLRVILGARAMLARGDIGVVQFEYNRAWARAGSTLCFAVALLRDLGYRTYALGPDRLSTFDVDDVGEFFSYANFVAVGPKAATWIEGVKTSSI